MATIYNTGTVSVTAGGTTVTGVGTTWIGSVFAGDLFTDPAQGMFARVTADAVSNTSLSIAAWPGTTMSGDAYEILLWPDSVRSSERARRYAEIASQIENTGIGIDAFGDFVDRDAYDDQVAGYAFLSFDGDGDTITDPVIFLKNSSTNADWSAAVEFIGPHGIQGETGLIGEWKGSWLTATAYAVNDIVTQDGSSYICLTAHTSGTFATDLAATKWQIVAQKGDTGTNGTNGVDGKFSGTELVKTSAYTAAAADSGKTIILNKATADTLSFDAAATLGSTWMVMVKNIGAGTWTLDPNGSETIDGAATISLATGQSMVVSSNGTALRSFFLSTSSPSISAKTASFSVAASDNRATFLADASTGAVTASLLAAATAGAGFEAGVKKTDSSVNTVTIDPNGSETIDGALTFVLDEQYEEVVLRSDGTNWQVISYHAPRALNTRATLTANRTYYVRTDGSDSNNGLANTSGGAFLTIQKAINAVAALDISIYDVTIQVADGTYTGSVTVTGPWVGSGTVTLVGNTTTPANAFLNVTGDAVQAVSGARLAIGGFKLSSTGVGLRAINSQITVNAAMEYGANSSYSAYAEVGGRIQMTANFTVSGGGFACLGAQTGGIVDIASRALTLTGTPAFSSAFASFSLNALLIANSFTFSGSATGARYSASTGGVIATFGGGASYLPGNSSGSADGATGGIYA